MIFFFTVATPWFLVKKIEVVLSSAPLINSFWKDASLKLRQMERHGPRPVALVELLKNASGRTPPALVVLKRAKRNHLKYIFGGKNR